MRPPACHVVGAGLAGLAAALRLAEAGVSVRLHEASVNVGGRCRSLPDPRFGVTIDNGSHLAFTANTALLSFLRRIEAPTTSLSVGDGIAFRDVAANLTWTLTPRGESPLWLLGRGGRIPGVSRLSLISDGLRLLRAKPGEAISDVLETNGTLWRRLWRPILEAVFNADATTVSAVHAAAIVRQVALSGAFGGQPLIAARPWSEIVGEPALAMLRRRGVSVEFGRTLLAIERGEDTVRRLLFRNGTLDLDGDAVILAVPSVSARRLCPDLVPPLPTAPIVNLHFETQRALGLGFIGLVGGIADWVFWRGNMVSATLGNAAETVETPAEDLAAAVWAEVRMSLPQRLSSAMPTFRRIAERRATIGATPADFARRPGTATPHPNLFLAGDWTATGLPSTLEGAVRSGDTAAAAVLAAAQKNA